MKGDQSIVFRGSLGYFFDRVQGDSVFGQSGNPPTGEQSTVYYSTLQSLAAGGQVLHAPPAMLVYYYDAKIGSSLNFNGGVQMVLPWSSTLDVSYVGSHNFNSVAFGAIPIPSRRAADGPECAGHRDGVSRRSTRIRRGGRARCPGATAFTTDLLRPYRGIGAVNTTWPMYWTHYDSMQVAFNRRLRNGWQAGLSLDVSASGSKAIPCRHSTSCTTAARSRSRPIRRRTTRSCRTSAVRRHSSGPTSCGTCRP